jgi:UDPglucose 6-dehydrogenase
MNGKKIIVLKSTVPVGTNRKVRDTVSELTDHPFGVVSNPEFLKEGAALDDFLRPDRVVIGADDREVAEVMCELYRPFVRTGNPILVMDPPSAELTKYASNAMLASRISFMNEMARICEKVGADISQIRKAVGSDSRIGHAFLFAGVGYGGSCFPKDVRALLQTAKELGVDLPLVRATEEVNNTQKLILIPKIESYYGRKMERVTLAVWGLAFKPKTDDMREAPSIALVREVVRRGARVRVFDPEAMKEARRILTEFNDHITYCRRSYEACEGADGLVLVTEWNEFRNPDFERIRSLLRKPVIFDGRNIYNQVLLQELGFDYFGIGKG